MPSTDVVYLNHPKVSLRSFVEDLTYEFSDMPVTGLESLALTTITRLCRESNVLQRGAIIYTQACVDNYILDADDCMDIVAVLSVCRLNGCKCGKVVRSINNPCRNQCGTVTWFEKPNTIYITNGQDCSAYDVKFAVAPKRDACEVDESLITEYYDVIADGIRAKAYGMSGKPWSNENKSQRYYNQYLQAMRTAATEQLMGGQRGAIRLRPAHHV